MLASLFSGPEALVDPPRPCSISKLQAMYSRCAHIPHAWEPLAAVWDTALRALGKFRGVPAPSFLSVMDNIANLLRKPVRARCTPPLGIAAVPLETFSRSCQLCISSSW